MRPLICAVLATAALVACDDESTRPPARPCTLCAVTIPASRDNTLYDDPLAPGSTSNGAGETMVVGTNASGQIRRALVRFEVASFVPAAAMVDSVRLNMTTINAGLDPRMVRIHRVLGDWGQSSSNARPGDPGATAAPGDATWLHAFFPDSLWTTPGGDFLAVPSGSTVVAGAFVRYRWPTTSTLTSDVQGWLDSPDDNFGWVLTGDEAHAGSTKSFGTMENNVPERRPTLEVFYRRNI